LFDRESVVDSYDSLDNRLLTERATGGYATLGLRPISCPKPLLLSFVRMVGLLVSGMASSNVY